MRGMRARHYIKITFRLGTIFAAYRDFDDGFLIVEGKMPVINMVINVTMSKMGKLTKQDTRELCRALSVSSIEGALRKLVKARELKKEGSGKETYYVRLK